jgi:hypothetical protein
MAEQSEKDDLLHAFRSFQDALLSNDLERLDRLLAPDYRGYSLRGELEEREEVLAAWGSGGIDMAESRYEDLQVDIRGEVGIITGIGFVAGSFQEEPWHHHLHFCDLYTKSEEGWQIFLSHAVELEPGRPEEPQGSSTGQAPLSAEGRGTRQNG